MKLTTMKMSSIALAIMALTLSACSSTDVLVQSKITMPDAYEQGQIAKSNQVNLQTWWQSWQDPILNQLIETGLQQNFALAAAQKRYEAAAHMADLAKRDLLPMVGAGANVGYHDMTLDNPLSDKTTAVLGALTQQSMGKDLDTDGQHYAYGVSASWEPDIFGGKKSDADAAQSASLGVKESIYGAQVMIAAAIADNYVSHRILAERLVVLDQSIATMAQLKRYVEGRFRAGQATRYEIDNVATQLTALQAKRPNLLALMVSHEKQIAVLIGQVPTNYQLPQAQIAISTLKAPIAQGSLPSDLLMQRPDLRAHQHNIEALSAKLASAKADLLPRFYVNFSWLDGKVAIGSGSNLSGYGSIATFGVNLPIFTAGRIKANIAASNARLQAAVSALDDGILRALSEVEIAYAAQYRLNQSGRQWQSTAQAANQQANRANKLYQHGEKQLSDVLLARLNALAYQDQYWQTHLMSQQASIKFYQALGGGWQQS